MEVHLNYGGTSHSLDLNDGSFTLGRAENSQIRIPVMSVSRQHAILRVEGEKLYVRNLSTTSGTLLDGRQIETEEELEIPKQSRLTFGEAELWRDDAVTSFGAPLSEHGELRSRFSFSPNRETTGMARDRILQMLSSLFDLIAAAPDDESFEKNACQFVGKVVHADRVLILEDDGLGTPFLRRGAWFSSPDHAEKYRLSAHFIEEVCRTKSSLLIEDAMNTGPAAAYQSVQDLRVRSAIIAPLLDGDRVRGILYADNLISRRRYEEDDLQVLTAIARAVGVKRQRDDEQRERRRAARVQESLLPRELPQVGGLDIHGHLEMCQGVGGDLYLCVRRPSGRILLAVGDVSGKGMAAALSMGAATMLLRILARLGGEPMHVLEEMHEHLRETLPVERFVTLFVAEYEPKTGKLLYASAGHEDALVIRGNGSVDRLRSTGLPSGFDFDCEYGQGDATLEEGDLLVIYTDGVTEATTDGDRFYGSEGAERVLVAARHETLDRIQTLLLEDIHEFLAHQHASDDITLLLMRRAPSEAPARAARE